MIQRPLGEPPDAPTNLVANLLEPSRQFAILRREARDLLDDAQTFGAPIRIDVDDPDDDRTIHIAQSGHTEETIAPSLRTGTLTLTPMREQNTTSFSNPSSMSLRP